MEEKKVERIAIQSDKLRIEGTLTSCRKFEDACNGILELAPQELSYMEFQITPEWLLEKLKGTAVESDRIITLLNMEEVKIRFAGVSEGLIVDYEQGLKLLRLPEMSRELSDLFEAAKKALNSTNTDWFEIVDGRIQLKESERQYIIESNTKYIDTPEEIEVWNKLHEAADIINKYVGGEDLSFIFSYLPADQKYHVLPSAIEKFRKEAKAAMVARLQNHRMHSPGRALKPLN